LNNLFADWLIYSEHRIYACFIMVATLFITDSDTFFTWNCNYRNHHDWMRVWSWVV